MLRLTASSCSATPPDASSSDASQARRCGGGRPDPDASSARKDAVAEPARHTVLVAESNRINQKVLSRALAGAGHVVMIAADGEAMLDRLEAGGVDLVVADVDLPSVGGIEASLLYRVIGLGRPFVPIIGLTADNSADARRRCLDAGLTSCLLKPVEASALIALVGELLLEHRQATAGRRPPEAPASEAEMKPDGSVRDISSHPRFAAVAAPVLDRAVLESLRDLGGDAFVDEIVEDFAAETDDLLLSLCRGVARADVEAIRPIIHALRSSATNMGGTVICGMLDAWEHLTGEELRRVGAPRLAELVSEALKLRRALASFKDGLEGRRG